MVKAASVLIFIHPLGGLCQQPGTLAELGIAPFPEHMRSSSIMEICLTPPSPVCRASSHFALSIVTKHFASSHFQHYGDDQLRRLCKALFLCQKVLHPSRLV
jgi:hypothetical protein